MREAQTKNAYKAELDYLCTFKPQREIAEKEIVVRDKESIDVAQHWHREDIIRKANEKARW